MGLMLGVALKHQSSIGPSIGKICLKNGVYIGYYGQNNNVLRIQPALTIDPETAKKASKAIVDSVFEFEQKEEHHLNDDQPLSFFSN